MFICQQHIRLYETVKFLLWIFTLNLFAIKQIIDWEYLTVRTKQSLKNLLKYSRINLFEKRDGTAVSALGVRSRKLSNIGRSSDLWPKMYYLELLRASEGTLSRGSRLYLQSLAPTNPHWARVVTYGPFSSGVIHKEGLCHSSGDIDRLMIITYLSI
jgi:hypothetical protein